MRQLLRTDLASLALPAGVWVQCNFFDGVAVADTPSTDSSSCSNSSIRSFRLAACRSCAGVNCNRSIASRLRKPYGNATQYFPTRPLVRKPSVVVSPHPIRLPLDTVRVKRVRARPSALADLDMDGVVGRGSHSHEVSNTSKGLDHSDQLWQTCHARWWSSLQRGSPPPPPLTDPAGLSFIGLRPQRQAHPEFG